MEKGVFFKQQKIKINKTNNYINNIDGTMKMLFSNSFCYNEEDSQKRGDYVWSNWDNISEPAS